MICGCCGDKLASSVKSVVENGEVVDVGCDRCQGIQPQMHDDVYFRRPYYSEALGTEFTSKAQKAAWMKAHDVSEAGERKMSETTWVDGTREHCRKQFDQERPKIRQIYKEWQARRSR